MIQLHEEVEQLEQQLHPSHHQEEEPLSKHLTTSLREDSPAKDGGCPPSSRVVLPTHSLSPPAFPLLIQLGDEIAGIGEGGSATVLGPSSAQYDLISGSPPPSQHSPSLVPASPLNTGE